MTLNSFYFYALKVACSFQAATDIMEKENAALVDRPDSISAGKVMSGDKRILLIGQGERFRKLRKYAPQIYPSPTPPEAGC